MSPGSTFLVGEAICWRYLGFRIKTGQDQECISKTAWLSSHYIILLASWWSLKGHHRRAGYDASRLSLPGVDLSDSTTLSYFLASTPISCPVKFITNAPLTGTSAASLCGILSVDAWSCRGLRVSARIISPENSIHQKFKYRRIQLNWRQLAVTWYSSVKRVVSTQWDCYQWNKTAFDFKSCSCVKATKTVVWTSIIV